MRPFVAAAAAALLLAAGACSGGATSSGSTGDCGRVDPPPGSLLILPAGAASRGDQALCRIVQRATNVVVSDNSPEVAKRLVGMAPDVRVWQERQLQYAPRVCPTCADTVVKLDDIEAQHPLWVLEDASGRPVENGGGTLLDFGDPDYQAEWAQRMADSLAAAPWTGVVVDADNTEPWASPPIDPARGEPMTDDNRADYLAEALALVRGALKTQGWSLVAHNPPITDPDEGQIGSTDAVLATTGFSGTDAAGLDGALPLPRGRGQPRRRRLDHRSPGADAEPAVFGFASYLLVAGSPYWRTRRRRRRPAVPRAAGRPDRRSEGGGRRLADVRAGRVAVNPGRIAGHASTSEPSVRSRWSRAGAVTPHRPYLPVGRHHLSYSEPARATERFCAGPLHFRED